MNFQKQEKDNKEKKKEEKNKMNKEVVVVDVVKEDVVVGTVGSSSIVDYSTTPLVLVVGYLSRDKGFSFTREI